MFISSTWNKAWTFWNSSTNSVKLLWFVDSSVIGCADRDLVKKTNTTWWPILCERETLLKSKIFPKTNAFLSNCRIQLLTIINKSAYVSMSEKFLCNMIIGTIYRFVCLIEIDLQVCFRFELYLIPQFCSYKFGTKKIIFNKIAFVVLEANMTQNLIISYSTYWNYRLEIMLEVCWNSQSEFDFRNQLTWQRNFLFIFLCFRHPMCYLLMSLNISTFI